MGLTELPTELLCMTNLKKLYLCIGLQDLGLPAFVTLTIVDEAVHENSIRMWAKWELITAVKHFP